MKNNNVFKIIILLIILTCSTLIIIPIYRLLRYIDCMVYSNDNTKDFECRIKSGLTYGK